MQGRTGFTCAKVADRLAIEDLELRWCRAIDRLDLASMPSLFHPDAYDDHGAYRGDIPGLIDWLRQRHAGICFCMHQMTNVLVEFADEDNALVEACLAVVQRFVPGAAAALAPAGAPFRADRHVDLVSRARYVDRVQRRDGEWKILRRTFIQEWRQVTQLDHAPAIAPGAFSGRRDLEDFVFSERRAMGIDRHKEEA
jgi:hypothetical protein